MQLPAVRVYADFLTISRSSISSGLRGSVVWYFGSWNRLLRKLIRKLSHRLHGFFPFSFRQRDQLFRHPLADAFRDCVVNANSPVVPIVTIAFSATLSFVIFRLLETDNYSLDNFFPVLKLNTASHDR